MALRRSGRPGLGVYFVTFSLIGRLPAFLTFPPNTSMPWAATSPALALMGGVLDARMLKIRLNIMADPLAESIPARRVYSSFSSASIVCLTLKRDLSQG